MIDELRTYLDDFHSFCSLLNPLWGKGKLARIHKRMCKFLQRGNKRKLILAFRGSHKSTILQMYLIWRILNNLNISILRTSSTKPLSDSFVSELKHIFEAVPFLRPLVSDDCWRSDEFTIQYRSTYSKDPTLMSGSIGTNVVGRHPQLIVCDDPVDLDNSRTDGQREKVAQWLKSLESLAGPNGEIIVVGTRWHREDVYGQLIASGKYDVLTIPAEEEGKPAWGTEYPIRVLQDIKAIQGELMYSMQYLLDAAPEQLATFKQLPTIDSIPLLKDKRVYVDFSWGADGDYAVAILAGVTPDGRLILLDAIMSNRHSPERLVESINELAGTASIKIDASAMTPLSQTLGNAVARWSTLANKGSKEGRIMKMQLAWNSGRILILAANRDKFRHLEQERYDWDFAREYDDALDCVSYAYSDLVK